MPRTTDGRTRRALIIGVDAYTNRPLDGCVADAKLIEQLLRERFDFKAEHIRTLINGDATRDAVLAEFDELVDLTAPDDVAFVFYAGHGSKIVDDSGDEATGFDNTIMVSDAPRQDIIDDEIRQRLEALGEKTPYTTLVIDACNSGTITRDAFATQGRSYPAAKRSELKHTPPKKRARKTDRPSADVPTLLSSSERYVLIAACRDGELAYEAAIAGDPNTHHGALTLALNRELQLAKSGETWRDVFDRAARSVTATNAKQHPVREGAIDRELFGLRELVPMSFVAVTDRATDSVVLDTGAIHGATVGSKYDVYAAGAKETDSAQVLGVVEILVVKGTTSRARIVSERAAGAIVEGSRAVETEHAFTTESLKVQLAAVGVDEKALDLLRKTLEGVTTVREVKTTKGADVRVLRLAPREAVTNTDPLPDLGIFGKPLWAIIDRGGHLIAPADPRNDVDEVVRALVRRASYENTLALDNTDPKSRMRGRVTLQLMRPGTAGAWVEAARDPVIGLPIFDSGDAIGFRIVSALEEPVYVTVFDFDPLGDISRMPKGNAVQLAAGKTFELGTAAKPKHMNWDGPDAVESFKLFASKRMVDFANLERRESRTGGTGTRSVDDAVPLNEEDWTSQVVQILVRRKTPLQGDGRAVKVDGATVAARGLSGVVRSVNETTRTSHATRGLDDEPDALTRALDEAGMVTQQSLVIDEATTTASSTRGADDAPSVELTVPDPGDDFAQVAMTVDEAGVISWHFAPALDAPDTSRSADAPAERTRTFHIPMRAPMQGAPSADSTSRGVLSAIGQRLIKVYAFPVGKKLIGQLVDNYGEQLELQRTPYRVRTFLPEDYASPDARVLEASDWDSLSRGRALLMIHGTNSRTHTAFGGLPRDFVVQMHARYEGRVFAFDHPTLTHTPRQNIETLLAEMPDTQSLDVDIICHSRGGLVSRVLSEKQGELAMGGRSVRIGNIVFVGAPNAGTRLADENCIGDYLDTITNLLDVFPTNLATDMLGYALTGLKLVATGLWSSLKGLHSMQPGGPFATWLNAGDRAAETKYFALTSDYTPRDARLAQLMADRLMDRVFKNARNDMVVPTDGVYAANGSGYFPIEDQLVLGADDGVAHTHFFEYPRTTAQIADWLASDRR